MSTFSSVFNIRRSVVRLLGATLAATLGALSMQALPAQAATATINNVSFKAPVFDSYNHSTGGGAWNDGSVTYDKGELLGTNFACNDYASFLLELNTSATPTKQPAPYKVEVRITYTWDSTGQSGVSLTPDLTASHLKVNKGNITNTYQGGSSPLGGTQSLGGDSTADGGFNLAGYSAAVAMTPAPYRTDSGTEFTSGATSAATFVVENVNASANVIIRSDALIRCKSGASPTGNLQAALSYVKVIAPGAVENISAGNQTVNFRGVGNLAGLTAPAVTSLTVAKYATTATSCTGSMPAQPLTVSANTAVRFCYTITNNTSVAATGVTVVDDRTTPTDTSDDIYPTVSWPGAVVGTIPANATVNASYLTPTTYATGTVKTNTVTVTSSNANTVTATATVTTGSAPQLLVTKTLTSPAPTAAGDIVTYNVTVTNTGNSSVTAILVTDPNLSPPNTANVVRCPSGTSANPNMIAKLGNGQGNNPPVSETCTVSHVVTTAEATAGKVLNTAYAASGTTTFPSNTVVTYMPTMASPYELSVVKTQTSPLRAANSGDAIQYSVLITNISANTITNVGASDALTTGPNAANGATSVTLTLLCATNTATPSPVTLPTTLTSGASIICTASYTALATDVNYTLQNVVKVTSTQVPITYSNVVSTPIGAQPSLSILKLQSSSAIPKAINEEVTYSITAANTGNVALTNVVITDLNATLVSCTVAGATVGSHTSPSVSLGIGISFDCVFKHIVTSADMTAAQVDNIATVAGLSGATNVTASSDHVITPIAKISISKTSPTTYYQDTTSSHTAISYTVDVRNSGQVPLTNVVITDALLTGANGTWSCPGTSPYTLAIGATMTCTGTYTIQAADVTAQSVTNTASVSSNEAAPQSASVTTPYLAANAPDITIVKTQTGAAPTAVGSVIHYSIVVTNTGLIDLTNVVLTDINADPNSLTCPTGGTAGAQTYTLATLAISGTFTCTATHTVTDLEMKAGTPQVVNTASVVTSVLAAHTSTVTTPLTPNPQATITKTQTGAAVSQANDVIHYSIVVTNTGNETLTGVVVADSTAGVTLNCPGTSPYTLAIGASVTCTAAYTVQQSDVDAGIFTNTATATATELGSTTLSASASTNLTAAPSVSIVKSRVGTTALNGVGQIVSYQIVVTNTGNVALNAVNVDDANTGSLSCTPPTEVASLAVNATIVCTGSHSVTSAEVTAGQVINTAYVRSTTGSINQASNLVTTPVSAPPAPPAPVSSLTIVKALSGSAPTKVGDIVSYNITVTNNGETNLAGVNVNDANAVLGNCSVALPATLATGASFTCTATHVVTDADMAAGKVDNTAVASSSTGSLSRTSNLVTVPLAPAPAITIVKSLSGAAPSKVGDTIAYSIVVTNTGNVTVTNLTVADANATLGTCTPAVPATLAPAASITCAATHVVTDADMTAGKVDNVATASGTAAGATVSGSGSGTNGSLNVTSNVVTVPLVRNPAITIVKSVTGAMPTDIGGYVHYTIVVTNSGNVTLHDVQVFDDNATITGCSPATPAATLLVGASITCSARHAVTADDALAGKIINVAYAKTAENVTASSGTSGSVTGGNGSSTPSNAAPGTVKANSNETVVLIKFKGRGFGTGSGNTVVLGAAALKNPKLSQLAYTGDDEPLTSDFGFFLTLMAAIALLLGARRIARR